MSKPILGCAIQASSASSSFACPGLEFRSPSNPFAAARPMTRMTASTTVQQRAWRGNNFGHA
eukprot:11736787-Alexandrium_andersonii.AAC.1